MKLFIGITAILAAAQFVAAAPCKKDCKGHDKHHDDKDCGCDAPLQAAAPEPAKWSMNPLHGTSCDENGSMMCLGNDFGTCNYGKWHVIDCLGDTACMPNDFQCVPLSDWNRVNEQVNGQKDVNLGVEAPVPQVWSKNPLHGQPCEAGDGLEYMQCLGNDFGTCNYGRWHVIDCINDTRCVPNDYQCVPNSDWERVNNEVNGNKDAPLSAAAPCQKHKEPCSCE